MRAGGSVSFEGAIFDGPTNFSSARVGQQFNVSNSLFSAIGGTDFTGMTVGSGAYFLGSTFYSTATLHSLDIVGDLDLSGASFTAESPNSLAVVFNGTKVGKQLLLYGIKFVGPVEFENVTYQDISGTPNGPSDDGLLRFLEAAQFAPVAYTNLENFYQREGMPDRAVDVYVAEKERERSLLLRGLPWLWNLFLDRTVGYWRLVPSLFYLEHS
jgi:hypothetical protein